MQRVVSKTATMGVHQIQAIVSALLFIPEEMIVVINFLQKVLTYNTNSVKIELSKLRGLNYERENDTVF